MIPPTKKLVLPADVYDALEFSALAFGGIGGGSYGVYGPSCASVWETDTDAVPLCAIGHLCFVASESPSKLRLWGIAPAENDTAVADINARLGKNDRARVPFPDWCAELGVERGA